VLNEPSTEIMKLNEHMDNDQATGYYEPSQKAKNAYSEKTAYNPAQSIKPMKNLSDFKVI